MITLPPNLVSPKLRATGNRGDRFGKHAADYEQLESFRQFFIATSCVILSVYLNLISVKQKSRSISTVTIIVDLLILAFLPLSAVYPFLIVLSTIGIISVGRAYTVNSNDTLKINSSLAVFALFLSVIMTCFTNSSSPTPLSHQTIVNVVFSIFTFASSTRRGISFRALPILTSLVAVIGSILFRLSLTSDPFSVISGFLVLLSTRRAVAILTYARFTLEFAAGSFLSWFFFWDVGVSGISMTESASWIRIFLGLVIPVLVWRMGSIGVPLSAPSPALTIVEVSNPGLRMRTIKEVEVPELKVEIPVESASTTTTAPSAVVVVEGSCETVVPDLNEDDDEDALFEKIAAARI